MNARQSLYLFLLATLVSGLFSGYYEARKQPEPAVLDLGSSAVMTILLFVWYHKDSTERQYPRSVWLNIGVLVLSIVALPYYLLHSRPPGERGRAILKAIGFLLIAIAVLSIGFVLGEIL